MFFLKIGLVTCVSYVLMTILVEVLYWAAYRRHGIMWFVPGKHPDAGMSFACGMIFGILWLISFSVAWYFAYPDLKSALAISVK